MNMVNLDEAAPKQRKTPVDYDANTREWLLEQGYLFGTVEKYNAYSNQLSDYMGFVDILAFNYDHTLAVQGCGLDISSHVHKMTTLRRDVVTAWLRNYPHRRLILIGWRKLKVNVKARKFFPRIIDFTLDKSGELIWKERI